MVLILRGSVLTVSSLLCHRCLQNYIPAHSLTLSCPVCRQTSILPEKGVAALQNNFFITNLMDVLQRTPGSNVEESSILETVTAVAAGKPLSCPNHDGNVSEVDTARDHGGFPIGWDLGTSETK
jgi:tripartite motif-containing protein 2/3